MEIGTMKKNRKYYHLIILLVLAPLCLCTTLFADTKTVTVYGYMDPYLAGMPDGSTAKIEDTAPAQSPLLALEGFQNGSTLYFATVSTCGFSYTPGCGPDSADGDNNGSTGSENSLSAISAPYNSLLGVFLNDFVASDPVPDTLDFNGADSFLTLAPALNQVFFIGDGLTGHGTGTQQAFTAPSGATRLFLGSMDGYGWQNNGGYQEVTITYSPASIATPEPSFLLLLGTGLGGLALAAWRRRK
jgi:hypothetical protein